MRYTVYLEVQEDGTTMAHVPALPGCVSTGATAEMAVARVPDAINAYCAWLRAHGEQAPGENEPVEIELGGRNDDSDPHLGDERSLLPTDRSALTSADVAYLMRLMSYSRRDLLDLVTGISREVLHWEPGENNDGWCIDDILEHVSRAERVYTSRMSNNVFQMLDEARRAALDRISRLTEAEMNQITEHQNEYWTARKVFRRFLEHEREHTLHIQQILNEYNSQFGLRSE